MEVINQVFVLDKKHIRMRLNKIVASSLVTDGGEAWATCKIEEGRFTAAEMKFTR
jgi:hypothetical protein